MKNGPAPRYFQSPAARLEIFLTLQICARKFIGSAFEGSRKAYLAAHQGSEAATEFQKILDHRGIVVIEPIGALAHLQVAELMPCRATPLKAKLAYQDFLTLSKEA